MTNLEEKNLYDKILEKKKAVFVKKIKIKSGEVSDTSRLKKMKREIARMFTALSQVKKAKLKLQGDHV